MEGGEIFYIFHSRSLRYAVTFPGHPRSIVPKKSLPRQWKNWASEIFSLPTFEEFYKSFKLYCAPVLPQQVHLYGSWARENCRNQRENMMKNGITMFYLFLVRACFGDSTKPPVFLSLRCQLHSPHNSVTFAEQGTEIVPLLTVLVLTFGSEPFLISTTGNTKLRTLIRLQLLEIAGH